MKPRRWIVMMLAIAIAGCMFALPASADPIGTSQLRVTVSGGPSVTLADDNGDGIITFSQVSFGGFAVVVSTGISRPTLGSSGAPHMDLSTVEVTGSGGGTLTVEFTDTGFGALDAGLTFFRSIIGGTCSTCTGTYSTYLDNSNTAFGTGTSLGSAALGGPVVTAHFESANLPTSTPYSLTQVVTIVLPGGGQVASYDAELQALPEPGSLILLGTGMAGLGLLGWRRSRTAVKN